jgi:hypothetical protein
MILALALLAGTATIARAAPPPTQAAIDDGAPLPPPPSGYEPVQDMDVSIEAHSPAVLAQKAPGMPGTEAQQNPHNDADVPSHFSIFGIPVKFNAPVAPPYNPDFTYQTYGGQPGRARDVPGALGSAGQP